jgi:predicted DNA-binding antitoxin AbrB/MazE fold protein
MTLEGTVIKGHIVLNQSVALPEGAKVRVEIDSPVVAEEEWLRRLRSAASDCGVSLTNEALSSEGIYD